MTWCKGDLLCISPAPLHRVTVSSSPYPPVSPSPCLHLFSLLRALRDLRGESTQAATDAPLVSRSTDTGLHQSTGSQSTAPMLNDHQQVEDIHYAIAVDIRRTNRARAPAADHSQHVVDIHSAVAVGVA